MLKVTSINHHPMQSLATTQVPILLLLLPACNPRHPNQPFLPLKNKVTAPINPGSPFSSLSPPRTPSLIHPGGLILIRSVPNLAVHQHDGRPVVPVPYRPTPMLWLTGPHAAFS